jgi:hypothetical protein
MRREVTDEGISYSFLDWRNPHRTNRVEPFYVMLLRTSEPNLSAPVEQVGITIEGSRAGEVHEGKQPGEASVYWVIPNVTACSTVALWLAAPGLSRMQAKAEVTRIAESLRPGG